MIVLKCDVICDICEKREDGFIRMEGAGRLISGMLGIGGRLGNIHTTTLSGTPWKLVGMFSDSLVCSDVCEKIFNEKHKAEFAERERKSAAERAARKGTT